MREDRQREAKSGEARQGRGERGRRRIRERGSGREKCLNLKGEVNKQGSEGERWGGKGVRVGQDRLTMKVRVCEKV